VMNLALWGQIYFFIQFLGRFWVSFLIISKNFSGYATYRPENWHFYADFFSKPYLESVRKYRPLVIARSVFCDEAISAVPPGDCFGKKRLAMTGLGIFGQTLFKISNISQCRSLTSALLLLGHSCQVKTITLI
jgi:hypothetical protein